MDINYRSNAESGTPPDYQVRDTEAVVEPRPALADSPPSRTEPSVVGAQTLDASHLPAECCLAASQACCLGLGPKLSRRLCSGGRASKHQGLGLWFGLTHCIVCHLVLNGAPISQVPSISLVPSTIRRLVLLVWPVTLSSSCLGREDCVPRQASTNNWPTNLGPLALALILLDGV